MPRTPLYQTTPFTIDPSARSTQTFAERYGVSPPHSNENLYGNDYTITGSHDDKCPSRYEAQTENHKVELSKAPSSSNIIQQPHNNNNNNGNSEGELAFKSTVIKGSKNAPNNTHSTAFDVEQRLQVSVVAFRIIGESDSNENCSLITLRRVRHIISVRNNFSSRSCETKRAFPCSECGKFSPRVEVEKEKKGENSLGKGFSSFSFRERQSRWFVAALAWIICTWTKTPCRCTFHCGCRSWERSCGRSFHSTFIFTSEKICFAFAFVSIRDTSFHGTNFNFVTRQ